MRLLREYIRILLKEQPDLGDVVFGEDEADTEYEAELYKFLSGLFTGKNKWTNPAMAMDPTTIDNLEAYMSDPRYRDTFKPYRGPAFRGVVMDVRELFRILLTGDSKVRPNPENLDHFLQKKNSQGFSAHDVNYSYRSKSNSLFSHWSKDIGVAYNFTDTRGVKTSAWGIYYPMLVVMYAQPGQTFLDADGLYNLSGGGERRHAFSTFRDEKEVIGMGDIQVSRILIKKEGSW